MTQVRNDVLAHQWHWSPQEGNHVRPQPSIHEHSRCAFLQHDPAETPSRQWELPPHERFLLAPSFKKIGACNYLLLLLLLLHHQFNLQFHQEGAAERVGNNCDHKKWLIRTWSKIRGVKSAWMVFGVQEEDVKSVLVISGLSETKQCSLSEITCKEGTECL